jgi:Xaa-Pro aminopeptidase
LAEALAARGIDGYLITQPANLRYFTGIPIRTAAMLVVRGMPPCLLVREQNAIAVGQAAAWCDVAALPGGGAWEAAVARHLGPRLPRRTGCDDLTFSLAAKLQATASGNLLCPGAEIAASLRRKKDPGEEARLRRAVAVADQAAAAAFAAIRPGVSELAVVAEMEATLRRAGADGTRFPTRFGSGLGSADCDVEPTQKPIESGEMGFLDIGPVCEGYLGDISRGFVVGRPSPEQARIVGLVLEALDRAVGRLRPGVPVADLCAAVHQTFDRAGVAGAFRHHLGHGLGLAMDPPLIQPGSTDRLEEGDFVALEPGLYLPGLGGVRFENNYRVGRDGPELLTRFPLSCGVERSHG